MNKKKRKNQRARGRPRATTVVPLAQPLLVKRKNTSPSRPKKYQRTKDPSSSISDLRKTTLEQKSQEKTVEEKLRDQLQKELDYLNITDSNLFDYDPLGVTPKVEELPQTPVRLPKKRRRKKSIEPAFTDFIPELDLEEEQPAPPVIVAQPIEELSISVPPLDEIELPSVLQENVQLSHDGYLQAEKDAATIQRIASLRKDGLWTPKRIPRIPPPPKPKSHWDYLLEEMVWMANDFRLERRFKIVQAKRTIRAISKKHREHEILEEKKKKEERSEIVNTASLIAKNVMDFWSKIEQIIKHKHEAKLEEKVQKARGQQLEFLVGQTERYSNKLAVDLRSSTDVSTSDTKPQKVAGTDELSNGAEQSPPDSETLSEPQDSQDNAEVVSMDTEVDNGAEEEDKEGRKEIINKAAEYATRHQPTGTTLSTTQIKTQIPSLLRGTLREYQHIGLDWLVSMYDAKLNGILADEMGLGKTIMTISLLAHLAECGIWGPHLIVVPTSVMINWERELKRWCPGLKVLTYYGSQKERKQKRNGWSKPNAFHVCITSYNLVSQDRVALSRKKWVYLILDEAQNIKNFRSQRWQVLLNFNTRRRLLLTGTPLQNNLMELWSLMHFLMPHIFQSHSDFKEWFCNPVNNMIEGSTEVNEQLIARLHGVLRPFILRRLKKDVEKQLPNKYEHVVPCELSKRQRFLYDEFMSRGKTKESLASGNYLSILNILMQLRKVCNHPDLFEERSITSPLQISPIFWRSPSLVWNVTEQVSHKKEGLSHGFLDSSLLEVEKRMDSFQYKTIQQLMASPQQIVQVISTLRQKDDDVLHLPSRRSILGHQHHPELQPFIDLKVNRVAQQEKQLLGHLCYLNKVRCARRPLYGYSLREKVLSVPLPVVEAYKKSCDPKEILEFSSQLRSSLLCYEERFEHVRPIIDLYSCYIPPVQAPLVEINSAAPIWQKVEKSKQRFKKRGGALASILHGALKHRQLALPEKRLIQFDCGKLQKLAALLRDLKAGGHRALIFTQMTRMLDILEIFLNLHAYTYMRLDGATKPEQRQALMERFNADPRIFCFILSTRSGGCGVNLIGADTVIFYDSDWNPAMDSQAQDRCHRIGQTREVHIYRLISTKTIEENILKKANQKRLLDSMAIEGGKFTTDFFQSVDLNSLVDDSAPSLPASGETLSREQLQRAMNEVEDESDVLAMREAQKEMDEEYAEFSEDAVANSSIDSEMEFIHSKLNSIQKYAFRFLEEVTQVVDVEEMDSLHEMVEDQAKKWKQETLKRIKETESQLENENLVYEVDGPVSTAVRAFMEEPMKIYQPPSPPPPPLGTGVVKEGHVYIHPFDYDPDRIDDSLFMEYEELFDWVKAEAKRETNNKKESLPPHVTKKRSVSRDKSGSRSRKASPSSSRRKAVRQSSENLFNYKQSSRKSVTTPRSRKRIDESLLVQYPFTQQEDDIIKSAVAVFGGNWILISDILASHLECFPFRSPAQCGHHYHTNLSSYATKKVSRKGQNPATLSPLPETEYQPPPFDKHSSFSSLIRLCEENKQEPSPPPTTLQVKDPHPSHNAVRESLGVSSFGVTPRDVIRLQQSTPKSVPEQLHPTRFSVSPTTSNVPCLSVPSPMQSVTSANSNHIPVVNIFPMASHNNSSRSTTLLAPPRIPRSPLVRSVYTQAQNPSTRSPKPP